MHWNNSKIWMIVGSAVFLTILFVYFSGPIVGPLITAGLTSLAALFEFSKHLTRGAEVRKEDAVKGVHQATGRKCRTLVYGTPRSGKTTTIRSLITHSYPIREPSTSDFSVHEGEMKLDLEGTGIPVLFADYKGQTPSQLILDPPEDFFGKKGKRQINVVLFVVDLFPEFSDEQSDPEAFRNELSLYEHKAATLISDRVRLNHDYINRFSVEPILRLAHSRENLLSVKLLINKINILEYFAAKGYITGLQPSGARDFALRQYEDVARALRKACAPENFNVPDFSVEVVNARSSNELRLVYSQILRKYSERIRE